MHKAFRIVEWLLLALAGLGLLFKALAWPGGDLFLLTGLAILSSVYFCGGYWQTASGSTPIRVFSGIAFSIAIIGLLFKLLHWPGAAVELLVGIGASLITTVLAGLASRSTSPALRGVAVRGGLLVAACVVAFFLPGRPRPQASRPAKVPQAVAATSAPYWAANQPAHNQGATFFSFND